MKQLMIWYLRKLLRFLNLGNDIIKHSSDGHRKPKGLECLQQALRWSLRNLNCHAQSALKTQDIGFDVKIWPNFELLNNTCSHETDELEVKILELLFDEVYTLNEGFWPVALGVGVCWAN